MIKREFTIDPIWIASHYTDTIELYDAELEGWTEIDEQGGQ